MAFSSVGRPCVATGVAKAEGAVDRVGLDGVLERESLPALRRSSTGRRAPRRPRRVIAAVLEPAQAVEEDGHDGLGPM